MPFATRDGVRIHWRLDGLDRRPALVLLNSVGSDLTLWDRAVPHLTGAFRLLRIDTRGHGASDAPDGPYSLAMLAADVVAVLDAAGIDRAFVAGVSLGGMVAMELALSFPERVSALALVCTSAALDPAAWQQRIDAVAAGGTAAIAEAALGRFFSPAFAAADPVAVETTARGLLAMEDRGYAGAGAAIRDMDLLSRLPQIAVPTLVVAGDSDISTPFAGHGDRIAQAIPGAAVVQLATAHLAPIENPAGLATALRSFLLPAGDVTAAADALFQEGLVHRRRVLGDAWVEKSLAAATPFNAEFQQMITRIAWREIWSRPGLDDRTRRLLVLAMTASLGRWEEFRLHVRAGLQRGGFTRDELKETLLQTAIYAGVPAANTGFAEAMSVLRDLDEAEAP
jgi:3-oxoadipate enol-lactonase/4-carboxymuconolactone decarboxylase